MSPNKRKWTKKLFAIIVQKKRMHNTEMNIYLKHRERTTKYGDRGEIMRRYKPKRDNKVE